MMKVITAGARRRMPGRAPPMSRFAARANQPAVIALWHRKRSPEHDAASSAVPRKRERLELLVVLVLALLLGGGVLVLLVLRDEVVHVGLGLRELHLVHALTGVPVEEGLAAEHGGELLGDALV